MAFSLIGAMGFLEYHYLKQKLRHVKAYLIRPVLGQRGPFLEESTRR